MSHRDSACEVLVSKGWLRHTPESFRRTVIERCRLEQFAAGTPVYSIGDEPGGMFGIVAGCLGVSVAPGEEGPYTAHFAMPGTWFGQAAAFTRQPRRVGLTHPGNKALASPSVRDRRNRQARPRSLAAFWSCHD